jgi:adenylylsulfate kinase
VPGVDVPYEMALAPELLIDTRQDDVATAAGAIAELAKRFDDGIIEHPEGVTRWAIWITGRPGSGKTTLARRVAAGLAAAQIPIRILDLMSARRAVVGREWASEAQEAFVHRTLALATKILCESGVAVILDAAAPRRAWRDRARDWITYFAEVQLVRPAELCAEREQAARWQLTGSGCVERNTAMAGPDVALDYEESFHPELRVHTPHTGSRVGRGRDSAAGPAP